MTESNTAVDTPIISGTTLLRSDALYERDCCLPSSVTVLSAHSNALYSRFCGFWVREKERVQTAGRLLADVKRSLIWPLTCEYGKRTRGDAKDYPGGQASG